MRILFAIFIPVKSSPSLEIASYGGLSSNGGLRARRATNAAIELAKLHTFPVFVCKLHPFPYERTCIGFAPSAFPLFCALVLRDSRSSYIHRAQSLCGAMYLSFGFSCVNPDSRCFISKVVATSSVPLRGRSASLAIQSDAFEAPGQHGLAILDHSGVDKCWRRESFHFHRKMLECNVR